MFCHSGLDPESSYFMMFWIYPEGYFAGLRNLKVIYDRHDDSLSFLRDCHI